MLDYALDWVPVASGDQNARFSEYSDQSIHDWHQSRGLLRED